MRFSVTKSHFLTVRNMFKLKEKFKLASLADPYEHFVMPGP